MSRPRRVPRPVVGVAAAAGAASAGGCARVGVLVKLGRLGVTGGLWPAWPGRRVAALTFCMVAFTRCASADRAADCAAPSSTAISSGPHRAPGRRTACSCAAVGAVAQLSPPPEQPPFAPLSIRARNSVPPSERPGEPKRCSRTAEDQSEQMPECGAAPGAATRAVSRAGAVGVRARLHR